MRLADLIRFPLAALWQQKMRTFLTTLGVVFGSFVLAASLSVGQGVQDTIERVSRSTDSLRKIRVSPKWSRDVSEAAVDREDIPGQLTDERRQRLSQSKARQAQGAVLFEPEVRLTRKTLNLLGELPHVENVIPAIQQGGFTMLGSQSQGTVIGSAMPDNADCRRRLVAGRFFDSAAEKSVVVHEYLLYRMGLTDDAALDGAVGQTLRVEIRQQDQRTGISLYLNKTEGEVTRSETVVLEKIRIQLPNLVEKLELTDSERDVLRTSMLVNQRPKAETYHIDLPIVGVVRSRTDVEEQEPWDPLRVYSEIILPVQTATDFVFRLQERRVHGLDQVIVIVDREEHAKEVVAQIKELGLDANAHLEFIERERMMYLLIFGAMTCVAAVALLVAALGIANTMLMSVLERTREIGVMKAVGAGNGHLLIIFLAEGALIGLLGGTLGLLLAWGASIPGDAWVRAMVSRELKIELKDAIFVFPFWLSVIVITFAILVTTLAAVCPARRAASIDPVLALRHE